MHLASRWHTHFARFRVQIHNRCRGRCTCNHSAERFVSDTRIFYCTLLRFCVFFFEFDLFSSTSPANSLPRCTRKTEPIFIIGRYVRSSSRRLNEKCILCSVYWTDENQILKMAGFWAALKGHFKTIPMALKISTTFRWNHDSAFASFPISPNVYLSEELNGFETLTCMWRFPSTRSRPRQQKVNWNFFFSEKAKSILLVIFRRRAKESSLGSPIP